MRNRKEMSVLMKSMTNKAAGGQFWRFENSADNENSDEATLYIYGDIVTYDFGGWNFPDDVVPNKLKDELKALDGMKTIHVRINSNGGSVFAAYAIMNLLKAHKARIITYNDGIAASAATIIAMAGDKIVTALGSVWMIHMPSLTIAGSYGADELVRMTGALNTIAQSMADIYRARTGIDEETLVSLMKEETWLTGPQAVEKGFADELAEEMDAVAYLSEDKRTAFFNGINLDLEGERGKKLLAMLKVETRLAANNKLENKESEERIMDLKDLQEKYPAVYEAAVREGALAERNRIKEIDGMALPGLDELTARAKFETGVSAGELAVEMIKAQKQKGAQHFQAALADAKPLDGVPAASAPAAGGLEEEKALLEYAKARAQSAGR
jgi:ATP-dependent protease ClpP protease subunit